MSEGYGVVAAGSVPTAQAGVEVLQQGGNAVDAVMSACLATAAGEPPLTSLAGGGVMLFYNAHTDSTSICDFSPNAPGLEGEENAEMEFFPVELQFGPATQVFHIGRGAAAVPAVLPGLIGAQERWGKLPLSEIIVPACLMLRQGQELDAFQASCIKLLEPILLHSKECRQIFAPSGEILKEGELCRNPDLADTLERVARQGWPAFLNNEFIPMVLEQFGQKAGGCITRPDLMHFQPEYRQSLRRTYRGERIFLPCPPAAGGTLIALALALLETQDLGKMGFSSPAHIEAKVAAMRVVEYSRCLRGDPLAPMNLNKLKKLYEEWLPPGAAPAVPPGPPAEGSTTHISAIDRDGNAAAVTISHGEGNGYVIGNTGITMNNMMGEADLHPDGFHRWPFGKRLATMMSPTMIQSQDGSITVLGTGGANRIRTALTQAITNIIDFQMDPQTAVSAGRLHWERGVLNAELFDLRGGRENLLGALAEGEQLLAFDEPHLFFGGVHAVRHTADGRLEGGGDRRRSGTVLLA